VTKFVRVPWPVKEPVTKKVPSIPTCEYVLEDGYECDKQAVTEWVNPRGGVSYRCAKHNNSAAIRWAESRGWLQKEIRGKQG
jgi:hypothetical protein